MKLLYYIDSLHTDWYISSVCFNFDDYNWCLMKRQNSVSQKIRILLKTNTKKIFLTQKCWSTENYEHVQHSILVGAAFQRSQVTKYKYFVTLCRNFVSILYPYFTEVILSSSTPSIFTQLSVLSTPYILKIALLLQFQLGLVHSGL